MKIDEILEGLKSQKETIVEICQSRPDNQANYIYTIARKDLINALKRPDSVERKGILMLLKETAKEFEIKAVTEDATFGLQALALRLIIVRIEAGHHLRKLSGV